MPRCLSTMMLAILVLVAASDVSLLSAETYRWIDADGSIHFSDTPPVKVQGKKRPVVQRDDTVEIQGSKQPVVQREGERKDRKEPISGRPAAHAPAGNKQQSQQQKWKLDAACNEEMNAIAKKLEQDGILKSCTDSAMSKFRQRYSPECLGQFESRSYKLTTACQTELETLGRWFTTEVQRCTGIDTLTSTSISPRCREQSDRIQKETERCVEISRNIARTCGDHITKANLKCFEEHQGDLDSCR